MTMPPGGYGFGLQDDKNDGVIYLTFETQADDAVMPAR